MDAVESDLANTVTKSDTINEIKFVKKVAPTATAYLPLSCPLDNAFS